MESGYSTRYLTPKKGVRLQCPSTGNVYSYLDEVPEDSPLASIRRDSLQFKKRKAQPVARKVADVVKPVKAKESKKDS